nr:hypothetical protein [Tanacetum cinerariifolium]
MASFDYRLNPLYPIKECSSCGALYTTDYCCSEESLRDRIICDLNKTLDLSQRPPQNCPKCGNPVDEPFVVKHDPGENSSESPPQINHHCCYRCGDSLEDIFCHQCTCEFCGKGAHYGYNCPPKVLIIPNPKSFNNQTVDELPQTLPSFDPTCYSKDGNSLTYDSKSNLVDDSPNVFNPPPQTPTYSYEFCGNDAYYGHDSLLQDILELFRRLYNDVQNIHEELAVYINTLSWDHPTVCYNNDNDEDYTIAIKPNEPDNSLSMGDEHLDIISTTKSDEFIKSSVENLVPNPSESKDLSDSECDVPACEDFTTFSNLLFDADYDFSSSDDQSFYNEDISKKIYSNPLFDEEIVSMKIDPHHFNAESDL